eukprot:PhF_6_TR33560/c0_g1_i1/m.48959/K04990/PKD2L1; polycystin 2L1
MADATDSQQPEEIQMTDTQSPPKKNSLEDSTIKDLSLAVPNHNETVKTPNKKATFLEEPLEQPARRKSSGQTTRRQSYFAVKGRGVRINFVIQNLKEKVFARSMYNDLFAFIPFLVLFVFFFLAGRDTEANYFAIRSIRDTVVDAYWSTTATNLETFKEAVASGDQLKVDPDKGYLDIGNRDDWFTWLKESVVQNTFNCDVPNASVTELAPLGQNYHFGALRLRTMRMVNNSCVFNGDVVRGNNWLVEKPLNCWGPHSQAGEQTTPHCGLNYTQADHRLGQTTTAREGFYHPGGFIVEIPFTSTCEKARAVVDSLADCEFLDNFATRFVTVEYFVYSPQFDTFHGVKLFVEVMASGSWIPQYKFRSFQVRTSTAFTQTVIDFVFLFLVFIFMVQYFYQMVKAIREKRFGSFVFDFWNVLQLVNLAFFGAVFGLRFQWWQTSGEYDFAFPYPDTYPVGLDDVMVLYDIQVYANSVNTILTFLMLLKFVQVNDRLGILTKTMAECQSNILGVLILFVFVVLGFAVTGHSLFGSNVSGYRAINIAMSTLMRMLVGNFDYQSMHDVNKYLTGFFFWSFVIIALFLLLNFVIAILSEAFAKVSGKAYSESMDQALTKTYEETRYFFTPTNIKAMINLYLHGKSITTMLEYIIEDLSKHVEETVQDEGAEEEIMLESHLKEWVRPEVGLGLGDLYLNMLWSGIVNDFEDAKRSSEETSKKEVADTVREGVSKAITDELEKIHKFDMALTDLEHAVTMLKKRVTKS